MKKIFLTLLFLCLMPAVPGFARDVEKFSTIEISARATVTSTPNTLTLSFAIETDAPLAREAVDENAERTQNLLGALGKVAGKDAKIWTSGFSLSPLYEKGDPTKPSGFRARNAVILESKMLDRAGAFIDEAAAAGVSRISNLTFTSDKEENLRREAWLNVLQKV